MFQPIFQGWAITGWAGVAMAVLVAASLGGLGHTEEGLRTIVRWSTRVGALVFALVFAARPLHQLLRRDWTAWALRNRRFLGVSFAVMHFTHLGALVAWASLENRAFVAELPPVNLYGGGGLYLLLGLMTLTSFDRTAALLGRRAWKALHVWGLFSLWFALTANYLGAAIAESVSFAPLALVLLAALGVRIRAWFARRSAAPAVAQAS